MTDADNMIHVAQSKFQKFIRQYRTCVGEPKQRMIGEDSPQAHRPCVQDRFMAEATQARMTVYDLDLLADYDISKYRKEGEDGWQGRFAVDNEKWDMVDLEAIGEVTDTCASFIGMSNDNNFVSSVDELLQDISAVI